MPLLPHWQIIERASGRVVVRQLELAAGPWSRLLGWQFRRRPGEASGLLIVPCRSVHTCFVRFPLDLIGLDAGGRVASLHAAVRPWRAAWCPSTVHAVLELPAPSGHGLAVGDQLQAVAVAAANVAKLPRGLRFLVS